MSGFDFSNVAAAPPANNLAALNALASLAVASGPQKRRRIGGRSQSMGSGLLAIAGKGKGKGKGGRKPKSPPKLKKDGTPRKSPKVGVSRKPRQGSPKYVALLNLGMRGPWARPGVRGVVRQGRPLSPQAKAAAVKRLLSPANRAKAAKAVHDMARQHRAAAQALWEQKDMFHQAERNYGNLTRPQKRQMFRSVIGGSSAAAGPYGFRNFRTSNRHANKRKLDVITAAKAVASLFRESGVKPTSPSQWFGAMVSADHANKFKYNTALRTASRTRLDGAPRRKPITPKHMLMDSYFSSSNATKPPFYLDMLADARALRLGQRVKRQSPIGRRG